MSIDNLSRKNRFKEFRIAIGKSQIELANAIGVDKTAISKVESEKEPNRVPTLKMTIAMEELFNLNRGWLETGSADKFKSLPENQTAPRLEAIPKRLYADPLDYVDKKQKFIHLPDGSIAMRVAIVTARAYAGYMRGFADPEYYDDLDDILIGVDAEANGTYIGFEVVGDSMVCLDSIETADESIFPGRIAIGRDLPSELWKTRLHTHNYKNWVFVHKTEGILIKQIANHDIENGIVTIHSLNPKYPNEDLLLEDMQQIFSVIQVVQRTRPKLK